MICLRFKQLAIDPCVCACAHKMVMSRYVDFHVRQQRSLLTPLLPILLLFVYVCLCVSVCDFLPRTVLVLFFFLPGSQLFNCSFNQACRYQHAYTVR